MASDEYTEHYDLLIPPKGSYEGTWGPKVVGANMRAIDQALYEIEQQLLQSGAGVGSAADLDETTTGPGNGPTVSTSGRKVIKTSGTDGPHAALNQASNTDVVLIDESYTIDKPVSLKTGVNIKGDPNVDTHLTLADNIAIDAIRPVNVQNVHLDGIVVDGNRTGVAGGGRLIGAAETGSVQELTVANCVLANSNLTAVNIQTASGGNEIANILLAGNTVRNCNSHGMLVNNKENTSSVAHDITFRRNRLDGIGGVGGYQGITLSVFGAEQCPVWNVEIEENYLTNNGWDPLQLQGWVYDSSIRRNRIEGSEENGIGVIGGAFNNTIEENLVRNIVGDYGALIARNPGSYPANPHDNTFTENRVELAEIGIDLRGAGTGNRFARNVFEAITESIVGDTTDNTIENNEGL